MDNLAKLRSSLISYDELGLPKGTVVHRIETYRTKRQWFEFWKPKYKTSMYALTNNAIYDITEAVHD